MKFKNTFMETLGIDFKEIGERTIATMTVKKEVLQPFGYFIGGASVALAESVASVGAAAIIDREKETCFGLEINANHIKAKRDGIVTAVADVVHRGKSTMVWTINITDEEDKLICISRCTMAIVALKAE